MSKVATVISRRQFMTTGSFAAGAAVVASQSGVAASTPMARRSIYPQDLELVTVTDTSFALSWFTSSEADASARDPRDVVRPARGLVRYGTRPDRLDRIAHDELQTGFHHVEVTGLTPGTTYYYACESDGVRAVARRVPSLDYAVLGRIVTEVRELVANGASDAQKYAALYRRATTGSSTLAASGSVTTLVPPAGRHLFTLALANDLHQGETHSGIIAADFPPPIVQRPGKAPYPTLMTEALIADARERGAQILIANGDLTAEAVPGELRESRRLLSHFGHISTQAATNGRTVLTSRGNHDRPHDGAEYRSCSAIAGGFDCFGDTFGIGYQQMYTTSYRGLRLIGLDTCDGSQGGTLSESQFSDLEHELGSAPDQPTIVFGHHPVTDASANSTMAGAQFDLDRVSAARLERLYSRTPGVLLHHSGHTHRTLLTSSPAAPHVRFIEVGAVKEYPAGYLAVRVYEGGIMANFRRLRTADSREWAAASSRQIFGLQPSYTLGAVGDRNFVIRRSMAEGVSANSLR